MADMFVNAIAYEEMMGRWSARLAPLFANFAKITEGGRVLDVGCGTGALVRTIVGMTRQAEIVGIDPVQPFIEYARTQCADARVTFDRGNALASEGVDKGKMVVGSPSASRYLRQPPNCPSSISTVSE